MITLKTLKDHTAQQVFDQAVNHLLNQNKKSVDSNGHCMYRGLNGLKCAGGCFISDEEYNKSMEGGMWDEDMSLYHKDLISTLQSIHDTNPVKEWSKLLVNCAKMYNLSFNYIKKE